MKNAFKGEFRFVKLFFQNWYKLKVNIIKKRKNENVFRVIYFARSLLKAIKYDVLVAFLYIECYRSAWIFLIVLMKKT